MSNNTFDTCIDNTIQAQDAAATTSDNKSEENIDFKVIYNKQKINVNFQADGTVLELKHYLQNIISVPEAMQKVMFKGLAKDNQTLKSLGIVKGKLNKNLTMKNCSVQQTLNSS